MRRTILFLLFASVGTLAYGQSTQTGKSGRASVRPPAEIPVESLSKAQIGSDDDELSETEILQRMGKVYDYQARLLAALAAGNHPMVEDLLDRSMVDIQHLISYPEVVDRPRFRELFRTVLTEYERYYQVPADSLMMPFGDIFAFRDDMFEIMNSVDDPLLEDVQFPAVGPVATTIPMSMNRLVSQSIAYLQRSPEKHVYNWLSRAQTYFPMIERILAEERMPDELKYLAMIESGLNPRARSWAAANGMWQFIHATGSAYGLDTDSWVDERLDPEKATRAAARHLRDLYELFDGDWHLALAGYNCSPGRIKRAVARAESRLGRKATFWDIYNDIPRETRNYVPMFIATALVVSNPEAFSLDMNRVQPAPEYAYHYVPVRGSLELEDIARMAGTDESTIRALNPELRRSQVPPSREGYYVRIPVGTYDRFAEAYAKLPPAARRSTAEHVVRRGDTLSKIAHQYGLSVTQIMRSNDLHGTTIRVGQHLTVPVPSYDSAPAVAQIDPGEVLTIEYGRPNIRPIFAEGSAGERRSTVSHSPFVKASMTAERVEDDRRPEEPSKTEESRSETGQTRIVYRVRRGDNLTDIGRKYGVSASDIRSWNNLRSSHIEVGQRLELYESNPARTTEANQATVYKVRRGDTLSEIARRYGVTSTQIRRWNSLPSSVIRVGQRLTINGSASEAQASTTYRVQRGDSLSAIAKKHGVTVADLKRWNSLKSSVITPGQRLKIRS